MSKSLTPDTQRVVVGCMQEMFEAQAERTPGAVALVCGEERLSYAALNARANQLAHYLQARGVGPETPVGVCLERSTALIVALLAVLKAGGAYVPLDPGYPAERLAFMLDDARVPVLISERHVLATLPSVAAEIICLDDCDALAQHGTVNPSSEVTAANLAYVIYTSGSTGRPKGVEVTHATVVHLFAATREALGLREGDVWTVVHSSGFDFSVWEIWGCLLQGGTLVVVPLPVVRTPSQLYDLLRRERVTVLNQTPSALRALLDERRARQGREPAKVAGTDWHLRLIVCGGDALDHELAAELGQLDIPVWNFYGPTESTVWTTCTVIADEGREHAPSIGGPIAGLTVHLADDRLQPVAIGAAGELLIGGAGLARGYRHRPDLTAERFIPDPFSDEPGARLYRTGDRARLLPGGGIEFLGRIDHQVKIRGYRIEPAEIETVLLQHAAVRECVVAARDDEAGGQRLVAYVVADRERVGEGNAGSALLDQWRQVYDQTYERAAAGAGNDPTFDHTGWNSSYTGQPMPEAEVREWLDATVERILALRPTRVLEIGCGTGMLLYRIAPHCAAYHGSDFSAAAIALLTNQLRGSGADFDHVALSHREATDFSGFDADAFDLVIINSVAQYFPGADYLARVLDGAVRVTRPGGAVFIGDVRSLPLLAAFTASVQLHQASPSLSLAELKTRIAGALAAEDELVLDPRFFRTIAGELSKPCGVRVMPKRGRYANEMTRFRFDVTLQVDSVPVAETAVQWRDWGAEPLTVDALRRRLDAGRPEVLALSAVPNPRVRSAAAIVELLAEQRSDATVRDLRAALDAIPPAGIEPDDLWRLGDGGAYVVDLSWAESGPDGAYDVVFQRRASLPGGADEAPVYKPRVPLDPARHWRAYANTPAVRSSGPSLVRELMEFLAGKLPQQMVPSLVVLLDALPLTANGKVDRKGLPAPARTRPNLEQPFVPPRTRVEERLARVWGEALGLDRVGVHDNFFHLGGHSLLAIQVASRLRGEFDADIALGTFFETPTVAQLAAHLATADGAVPPAGTIGRAGAASSAPLSFGQARIWFLNQLVPGTPVYNVPLAVPLDRRPDPGVLERALNEIVRRHDVLRATVVPGAGAARQVSAAALRLPLPLVDLSDLPEAERARAAQQVIADEAEAPFDLGRGPLVRARLVRTSEEEHVLLITMHHLVCDGWSIGVLLRELGALYEAFAAGRPSPLPPLPLQYADYATWQTAAARTDAHEQELRYWTAELAGASPTLDLPADRPRPRVQSFRGAREVLPLTPGLTRLVKTFSQREGVTPFMTLLAAFGVLLHRHTGQDDILVGAPIVNRANTDLEGVIGLFLNNVVLRLQFPRAIAFRTLLRQVRDRALGAYAHQDLPFEMLVESLNPARDSSRTPLFQVFFNSLSFAEDAVTLPGLRNGPIAPSAVWSQPAAAWSQFDLTCYVAEIDAQYQLIAVYSSDLFDPPRIAALLRQLRLLIEQAVAAPEKAIAEYSLRDAQSRALLPDPRAPLPEPEHEPVPMTFLAVARARPDHPAICHGGASWSYGDLASKTERIGRALLADGMVRGEVVAVSGPPGIGVIAGMLGILAGGGVMLPLDQNLPAERRTLMMREAGARRLLLAAQPAAAGDWTPPDGTAVTRIAAADASVLDAGERDAAAVTLPEIEGDDAAYVFFTSGTTGVPKGVLGCHKGLAHFLQWQRRAFDVGPDDRSAQLTGLSFDVVLRDIFLPLTSGASLHLPDDPSPGAGGTLAWLERERISILHTVPSIAHHWLHDVPHGLTLSSLRCVFMAGEPLTDALVRRWRDAFPASGRIVNLYGPTETTLAKCCYVVPGEPAAGVQPVGWPLPQTQALVMNGGELCGIGEPGEIAIRTPFRTRGYINAASENGRRFFENPFTGAATDLIYRTGDRGRYRPDGALEILGRLDDQVKIHGVRIEPGEVSAVLARHPAVAACVVTSVTDEQGDQALAAYVVCDPESVPGVPVLRGHLEAHLPAAMVPAYFVMMDRLPLTANGKVDRRQLPPPREFHRAAAAAYVAPRNRTESIIADIWAAVLGVARPGVFDNFFASGGHSLAATRIISRVGAAFQVGVPLRALFEAPTIAGLAAVVEERLIAELELMAEDEVGGGRP